MKAYWCGEPIYSAAERVRESCLRRDGSLFNPGDEIWTRANTPSAWTPAPKARAQAARQCDHRGPKPIPCPRDHHHHRRLVPFCASTR